jgi:hypothetical protein
MKARPDDYLGLILFSSFGTWAAFPEHRFLGLRLSMTLSNRCKKISNSL